MTEVWGHSPCGEWARALDDHAKPPDENDKEDETDAAAAVVAKSWAQSVTSEAEYQDQNDQNNKHFFLRVTNFVCRIV